MCNIEKLGTGLGTRLHCTVMAIYSSHTRIFIMFYFSIQVCSLLASAACAALLVFITIEYVRHRKHESQLRAKYKYKNYDSL